MRTRLYKDFLVSHSFGIVMQPQKMHQETIGKFFEGIFLCHYEVFYDLSATNATWEGFGRAFNNNFLSQKFDLIIFLKIFNSLNSLELIIPIVLKHDF